MYKERRLSDVQQPQCGTKAELAESKSMQRVKEAAICMSIDDASTPNTLSFINKVCTHNRSCKRRFKSEDWKEKGFNVCF